MFPGSRAEELLAGILPCLAVEPAPGVLVSLIVRTMGDRNELLREALASVYMQSEERYEVLICFHRQIEDAEAISRIESLVDSFPKEFAEKVRVLPVVGGNRCRPLNAGLNAARGRFVAFLDDDDLLLENHFEAATSIPDKGAVIVQTYAARRLVHVLEEGSTYPYTTQGIKLYYACPYRLVHQLTENDVPICSAMYPLAAINAIGLRFDESLDVLEDWDFLMKATRFIQVRTVPEVTAVVNIRDNQSNTQSDQNLTALWETCRRRVIERFESAPRIVSAEDVRDINKLVRAARKADEEARLRPPRFQTLRRIIPPSLKKRLRRLRRSD